mgnify:CR=1 FL=1
MLSSYINENEECVAGEVGFWTGRWDTESEACQSLSGSIRIFAEYGSIKDNYDNNKPIFWKGATGDGPCECAPTGFYQPNHGGYGYTGTMYYWLGAPSCAWEGTETCSTSTQINIRYATSTINICSGTGLTKTVFIDTPLLEDATGLWDDADLLTKSSLGTKMAYVRLQDSGPYRTYSAISKLLGQPTLCRPFLVLESVELLFHATSASNVCAQLESDIYWHDNTSFWSSSKLYLDSDGMDTAANGFYSPPADNTQLLPQDAKVRKVQNGVLSNTTQTACGANRGAME